MTSLYPPIDEMTGIENINYNAAADFLELAAFLSTESVATSTVVNETAIGASEDYSDSEDELIGRVELPHEEEILCGVVERLTERRRTLNGSYPFVVDSHGDLLSYRPRETCTHDSLGETAYILSLLLSNLKSMSPILHDSKLHPSDSEVRELRVFFQHFATAAVAAEIQGRAWSFGFPRPDGSGFLGKLKEIWEVVGDGLVERQVGAPLQPKDDGIDIFAARVPSDRLPGFPIVAAQVATGKDYGEKSAKRHIGTFRGRWFGSQPATEFIGYMVVPFVIEPARFTDDVRTLGNILHRLRVPARVVQAARDIEARGSSSMIEGYEHLSDAYEWIGEYRRRAIGRWNQENALS